MECPLWQKPTADGRCIEKWWAGPPATWLIDGLAFAFGAAVFAYVASQFHDTSLGKVLEAGTTPNRSPGRRRRRRR